MHNNETGLAIIEVCKNLYVQKLIVATDGNVSSKVADNELLITPSGMCKTELVYEQLARIDLQGNVLSGNPSSEKWLHIEVYRNCPEAQCVIHAHPSTAVAWSIARPDLNEMPAECFSEVILAAGSIPFVPYAHPGSRAMGESIRPFLPKNRAMVLSRHGALTWGESLKEAFYGMERIENTAVMLKLAHDLGGLTSLSDQEVQALSKRRKEMGDKLL